ncbi:MAG: DUF4157 domain-containing protein [Anaerolineae bacterium]|nr:DUF4157 domain-containing protein [Anaerolineae bacterium]
MRTSARRPKVARRMASAQTTAPARARVGQNRKAASTLYLQRTVGNQAVQRMLQAITEDVEASSARNASPGPIRDFSQIAAHTSNHSNIQAKLEVSAPGDIHEREADRVADNVLRQEVPEDNDSGREIQARSLPQASRSESSNSEDLAGRLYRSKGGGSSLSDEVQAFFGPRLMHDFSQVRVHTDSESAHMNEELGAQAFAHDRELYFGAGRYDPQSVEGKRLLAHELTHVVQQQGRPGSSIVMRQFDWTELEPAAETGESAPMTQTQVPDDILAAGVKVMMQKAALERGKKKLEDRRLRRVLFNERVPYDRDMQYAGSVEALQQQERRSKAQERIWTRATVKKNAPLLKGMPELRQPGGTVGYALYKLKNMLFGGGREDREEALLWMKGGNLLGNLLQKKTTPSVPKPGYSR